MLEKIFRTEIIIERNQGKEISPDIWTEVLNVIGIRTKMISNDSGPPPIEAMPTHFDPDQIKCDKHFDNIF